MTRGSYIVYNYRQKQGEENVSNWRFRLNGEKPVNAICSPVDPQFVRTVRCLDVDTSEQDFKSRRRSLAARVQEGHNTSERERAPNCQRVLATSKPRHDATRSFVSPCEQNEKLASHCRSSLYLCYDARLYTERSTGSGPGL